MITFGSLFSGAGGLDLGLEWAGMKCVFQVENDQHCLAILNRHWPNVPKNQIRPCMGLVGGDPCPIRSHPQFVHGSRAPDLSGYFLAMVARCKPRWLLRENVPAPDVMEFAWALHVLGYAVCIIEGDSAAFTGQSRRREFVAGFDCARAGERFLLLVEREGRPGTRSADAPKESPLTCLTARCKRRNSVDDPKVCEKGNRLRHLCHEEREALQGWPRGFTRGVPNSVRERIIGNGVTAPVAEWLGRRIIEVFSP